MYTYTLIYKSRSWTYLDLEMQRGHVKFCSFPSCMRFIHSDLHSVAPALPCLHCSPHQAPNSESAQPHLTSPHRGVEQGQIKTWSVGQKSCLLIKTSSMLFYDYRKKLGGLSNTCEVNGCCFYWCFQRGSVAPSPSVWAENKCSFYDNTDRVAGPHISVGSFVCWVSISYLN